LFIVPRGTINKMAASKGPYFVFLFVGNVFYW